MHSCRIVAFCHAGEHGEEKRRCPGRRGDPEGSGAAAGRAAEGSAVLQESFQLAPDKAALSLFWFALGGGSEPGAGSEEA